MDKEDEEMKRREDMLSKQSRARRCRARDAPAGGQRGDSRPSEVDQGGDSKMDPRRDLAWLSIAFQGLIGSNGP